MYIASEMIVKEKISKEKNKIQWINRAKGIGILLVVIGHVLRGLNNAGLFVGNVFINIDYIIYSFHMPLFFFLSGIFFFKSLKKRKLKHFLLNKINLLFYLYFLWSVIQFMVQVLLNRYTNGNVNIEDFIRIFYQPFGQMWFLYVLLLIFIVNAFIFSLFSETYKYFIIGLLIIGGIILRIFNFEEYYLLSKLSANFLFFQLGILWSFSNVKLSLKSTRLMLVTTLIAIVFILVIIININANKLDYDYQLIPAIIGSMLICLISQILKSKKLNKLGEFSLQIYLGHILFASGSRIILHKFFSNTDIFLHIIIGLIFGIFGSILLIKLSERFKIFSFLFENKIERCH